VSFLRGPELEKGGALGRFPSQSLISFTSSPLVIKRIKHKFDDAVIFGLAHLKGKNECLY
jgi:hypothetical protein